MEAHSQADNVVENQSSLSVRHQSRGRDIQVFFLAAAIALLPGLLFAVDLPAWWNDPIKEDPGNYFFTATGTSDTSSDEALQQAQKNALELNRRFLPM